MSKELEKKIELMQEKVKVEKELEKLKVKDDGEGGRGIIVGVIVFLLPFVGIFTVESFGGKMACLGVSLLILLLGFNWYNQTKKKKKFIEFINKKFKNLEKKIKKKD